jgi:hypothetical protein
MRLRQRLVIVSVFISCLWASPASADLITYDINGTVSSSFNNLQGWLPGVAVGTAVLVRVTYNPDVGIQEVSPGINPSDIHIWLGDFDIHGDVYAWTGSGFHWGGLAPSYLDADGPLGKPLWPDYAVMQFDPNGAAADWSLLLYALDYGCACGTADTPGFTASFTSATRVPDATSTAISLMWSVFALHAARRLRFFGLRPSR